MKKTIYLTKQSLYAAVHCCLPVWDQRCDKTKLPTFEIYMLYTTVYNIDKVQCIPASLWHSCHFFAAGKTWNRCCLSRGWRPPLSLPPSSKWSSSNLRHFFWQRMIRKIAFFRWTDNLCLWYSSIAVLPQTCTGKLFFKSVNRKSANSWGHSAIANPQNFLVYPSAIRTSAV